MECRLTFRPASYLLRVGNMEFLGLAIFVCPLSDSHLGPFSASCPVDGHLAESLRLFRERDRIWEEHMRMLVLRGYARSRFLFLYAHVLGRVRECVFFPLRDLLRFDVVRLHR